MAIALITGAHKIARSATSPVSTSPGVDSSGGNFSVVGCGWVLTGAPTFTTTDSKSNSPYAQLTAAAAIATWQCRIDYFKNAVCGSGHTWTGTTSAGQVNIAGAAFSGVDVTSPFDAENHGAASVATTVNTGTVTPAVDGELLITVCVDGSVTNMSPAAGFTVLDTTAAGGGFQGLNIAYQILGAGTAGTPIGCVWTADGTSVNMVAAIASFKPTADPVWGLLLGQQHNRIIQGTY